MVTQPFQGNKQAQSGAVYSTQSIPPHQLLTPFSLEQQKCWVDPISSSSHKTNGVSFHSCLKRATMIQSLLCVIIFNWEHLMIIT